MFIVDSLKKYGSPRAILNNHNSNTVRVFDEDIVHEVRYVVPKSFRFTNDMYGIFIDHGNKKHSHQPKFTKHTYYLDINGVLFVGFWTHDSVVNKYYQFQVIALTCQELFHEEQ